jgi:hypothetical protein
MWLELPENQRTMMEYGRDINRERTPERQAYRQSSVAFGVSTHLIRLAGALSPLLILEFVKEPSKATRWIRIASITAAGVNETLWACRIDRSRETERHR